MQDSSHISTLAIIPARGGSKGIPHKNIMPLCGKPLIAYTINAAHKATQIDATIVSTDDQVIADVAIAHGADVPFLRPAEFATDQATDLDYLRHALQWVRTHRNWNPEYIVLLQPTSPSRTAQDIDNAIELLKKTGADSVRTMIVPRDCNPYKMWTDAGTDGRVEHIFPEFRAGVRRQDVPMYYMPVAIVYAMRTSCIDDGTMWGTDVRKIDFPYERYTDIDTLQDAEHAAAVLQKNNLI